MYDAGCPCPCIAGGFITCILEKLSVLQESGRKRKWDLMAPAPEASQPAAQSPAAMGHLQLGVHEGGQFPTSQPPHVPPPHHPPQAGYAPDAGYQNLFGGGYPVQVSCWLFAGHPAHEMCLRQCKFRPCWWPQGRDQK